MKAVCLELLRMRVHLSPTVVRVVLAAAEREAWQPITTAPRDGYRMLVYAPGVDYDLPDIICLCAWDPHAGFCVDELRSPTHWRPLPPPPDRADLPGEVG